MERMLFTNWAKRFHGGRRVRLKYGRLRRCLRADLSWGKQVMRQDEPGRGGPLAPLDLRKIAPIEAVAASDRLGWVGLEADRYREAPAFEFNPPAITHHRLVLYT